MADHGSIPSCRPNTIHIPLTWQSPFTSSVDERLLTEQG